MFQYISIDHPPGLSDEYLLPIMFLYDSYINYIETLYKQYIGSI